MENVNHRGKTQPQVKADIVNVVELVVAPRVDRLPIVRGFIEYTLLTDDFSLDTVADLKVGVDESCTELIARAADDASLHIIVTTTPENVRIVVRCKVSESVDTTGFGWYVIECIADNVSVAYIGAGEGREAHITLTTLRD
ncbi:putative anti-sigma factor [Gordonia effusa NBRC 100432]|uniref:Putative anti-sigma factor n=2 Tax=Gordonia effusa TaxID=263908 RepID=H0R5G5_9ACTN|nr:putative anti-sigma factor [Gordonia effusa NBRC 100432]